MLCGVDIRMFNCNDIVVSPSPTADFEYAEVDEMRIFANRILKYRCIYAEVLGAGSLPYLSLPLQTTILP